ncbi:hypothetical protein FSP39_004905 [Pinctada imbricata]|uniref:Uncharacterized protein n=1 Tax=Pinctada imbricata TaxID=66713 RepID=A0AA88YLR1_PINIB|nr:hypothetical protein FSP39_004905 [Pinctada imbricata]
MKHKGLHINQRDQWATGADLGRPSATEIAEDETTPPDHTSTVMNTYMATDGKDSSTKSENITGKSTLKNDGHRGLIIGIVLAICAALVITGLVLFVTYRQKRKRKVYFNDTKKEPFLDTEIVQPDSLAFENTDMVITSDVADEGTKIPMSALAANDGTDMKTNGNSDMDTTVEDRHKDNAESESKETQIDEDRDTTNILQKFTNKQGSTSSEEDDTKIIDGKDTATEGNGMKISADTETNTNEGKTPP